MKMALTEKVQNIVLRKNSLIHRGFNLDVNILESITKHIFYVIYGSFSELLIFSKVHMLNV